MFLIVEKALPELISPFSPFTIRSHLVRLNFGKGSWYDNSREKIKCGVHEDSPLFPVAFIILGRLSFFSVSSLFM